MEIIHVLDNVAASSLKRIGMVRTFGDCPRGQRCRSRFHQVSPTTILPVYCPTGALPALAESPRWVGRS